MGMRRIVGGHAAVLVGLAMAAMLAVAASAAGDKLVKVSSDPYTDVDPGAQHKTQVEPDTFASGKTSVAVFQTGRVFSGGSTDVGWATSTDAGKTWKHGFLPGITHFEQGGTYSRASDPSVAYDAKHDVWMVSTLGISPGTDVLVSRSTDGGLTWKDPVRVAPGGADKNWTVCDNSESSPLFGNCYTEWDTPTILMSTSSDGGKTWGPSTPTQGNATGVGGQPLVQPDGTVVVPISSSSFGSINAFRSTNGGSTWSAIVPVATVMDHPVAGSMRSEPIISAELDQNGKVYVVWQDCRFRSGCPSNDIVLSTSTDGVSWSQPTRIPIDPVSSTVDHFIPGLG